MRGFSNVICLLHQLLISTLRRQSQSELCRTICRSIFPTRTGSTLTASKWCAAADQPTSPRKNLIAIKNKKGEAIAVHQISFSDLAE